MPLALGNADHWRQRAKEARRQAEQMHDPVARQAMLRVADSYEEIAKQAEALSNLGQTNN